MAIIAEQFRLFFEIPLAERNTLVYLLNSKNRNANHIQNLLNRKANNLSLVTR